MSRDASFRVTDAALRETTARLCAELVAPGASPPDWNDFEWDIARAVATMQGISCLLAARLRWRGPPAWQQFLGEQSEHAVVRDRRIDDIIDALDVALDRAGVGVVGLKGAALRRRGLFAPGVRPMGDVDLLARAEDLPAIAAALAACGYTSGFVTRRHVVFDRPGPQRDVRFGEHVDNSLKVEVHTIVADALPASLVDITTRLWPTAARPGINPYRDDAALLLHLLLHAAGNMRAHALRLMQLWDIAALSCQLTLDDWAELIRAPSDRGQRWWLWPPLHLAQRCTSLVVPESVQVTLESACPRRLAQAARRHALYDVSWSNLRIPAFPGIEWSRTPLEALRYARSRIAPGPAAREELAMATRVLPITGHGRWYDASHVSRIVRWVFSRPRRVQTMHSIRAALAQRASARSG
jgi:hypothetical protein